MLVQSMQRRLISTTNMSDGEQKIYDTVLRKFPNAKEVKVVDISGGCGAMFDVYIQSSDFNGKKLIQQHMMVNKALKTEISDMHGIRISTKAVES